MIESISILASSIVANALTSFFKTDRTTMGYVTQEQLDARKTFLRLMNLVMGVIGAVAYSYLLGEPLDVTSLQGSIEAIMTIVVTFASSQGLYFLLKK